VKALERLSLPAKLALGFGTLLILLVGLGVASLQSQFELSEELQLLYNRELRGVAQLEAAVAQRNALGRALRDLILHPEPAERAAARQRMELARTRLHEALEQTHQTIAGTRDMERIREVETLVTGINEGLDRVLAEPGRAQAELTSPEYQQSASQLDTLLEELSRSKQESARQTALQADEVAARGSQLTLGILALALVLGAGTGLLISRSIRRPFERLGAVVEELAAARLDVVVPHTGYPNEVGTLARSIQVLQASARTLADERWGKAICHEISARLRSATTFQELGQILLSQLAPVFELGYGAVYLEHERVAGFACPPGLAPTRTAAVPPDLVVSDKSPVSILSGIGEGPGRTWIELPIRHGTRDLGVVELAPCRALSDRDLALLRAVAPLVAANLRILERSLKTRALLAEASAQAARMESQAAQLEEQNVELEAQQASIKQTESWYRGIIEAADGLLILDREGRVILANPRAAAIFDYSLEEFVGQSAANLVAQAERTLREGMGKTTRFVGRRRDGSPVPVEGRLSRLPDRAGAGMCACASVRDVSRQAEMEQEIQQAQQLSDTALKLSHCGYWHVPLDGSGYYISSEQAAEIFGEEPRPDWRYHLADEWISRISACDPAEADKILASFNDALEGRTPLFDAVYPYQRPVDGRQVWLHDFGKVVRNATGEPTDMFGVVQDIQEQKLLEESTRASERQLRFMLDSSPVAVRVTESATIQVRYANAAYARLMETDLEGLLGSPVRVDYLDPAQFESIAARLRAGENVLGELVGLRTHRGREIWVQAAYVQLRYEDAPCVLAWLCDVTELHQARGQAENVARLKSDFLANMGHEIRTPIDAVIGMAHLALKTDLTSKQRDYLGKIQQSGQHLLGIIDDILDSSKSEAGELTLELQEFELAQAALTTRLAPGLGTREMAQPTVGGWERLRGVRVLLVEDNELNREVALGLLDEWGLAVEVAAHGEEALARLRAADVALVLMDMQMPVMDGLTATREIRRSECWKDLPIVAMTANARREDRELCVEAGMNDHVAKPIEPDELLAALLRWIQ